MKLLLGFDIFISAHYIAFYLTQLFLLQKTHFSIYTY